MNFSPFQDDIFTSNHANTLDIIGSSSCHIFKDNQSHCFDQFQNLCTESSNFTDETLNQGSNNSVFTDRTASRLSEDETFGSKPFSWCTDEPRPCFSPIYSYSGVSVDHEYANHYPISQTNAATAVAGVQVPQLTETYLTGIEDNIFSLPATHLGSSYPPDNMTESQMSYSTHLVTPQTLATIPSASSTNKLSFTPNRTLPDFSTAHRCTTKPVCSKGDLLSELTQEIFSDCKDEKVPQIRSHILQSVYNETTQQTTKQASRPRQKLDGSQFLAPIPVNAPAIPSLPASLAIKMKPNKNNGVFKFKKAYKRTKTGRFQGSYLDLITDEEEGTRPSSNTRLAKQQKLCLLDTIDDHYQNQEVKSQQINVSVYREIKTCNERDLGKGNFSGYVVADTSCFEGCQPFNRHKEQSELNDEINVGALSSCKRLGAVRKMRTPRGAEVVIISPRPKYQIGRTKTSRSTTPRRVDMEGKEMTCNTCSKKFRSSKLLFSHILKWHTSRQYLSS